MATSTIHNETQRGDISVAIAITLNNILSVCDIHNTLAEVYTGPTIARDFEIYSGLLDSQLVLFFQNTDRNTEETSSHRCLFFNLFRAYQVSTVDSY